MKLSANHLARYKQIAVLMWKYGRSDLVRQMNVDGVLQDEKDPVAQPGDATPEQLADDLEAMGPAYVKLGQVLAGRPDLLPPAYLQALARLQDRVTPFPYADVERIVAEELGAKVSTLFSRFDTEPMAAASLGQVHSAALRDGRPVVVKVQRPGIRKQIAEDFEVLSEIARFLDAHTDMGKQFRFRILLEEFHLAIQQELDYEREAQNLVKVGANLKEFLLIQVPQPVADYSKRCVLTMDEVRGRKITALSPLAMLEVKGGLLAEELLQAYLKQVLVDGIFHADPHPGNVFLTDDKRIALLDLGMVGHTTPAMQENLLKLLLAINEDKAEDAADLVIRISEKTEAFDPVEFRRRITQLMAIRRDQPLHQLKVGQSLLEISRSAAENSLFVPGELTLLGKTLLQLDEVGRVLDPNFNPNEAVRRDVSKLMSQRMLKDAAQGRVSAVLLEIKDFMAGLPGRLNGIMDAVANAELEVKIKVVDAEMVVEGIEKVANRITAGIVLAALIIGAALLMRVETSFRLFGYPGLAMLLFLAAVAGGFYLVVSTFVRDAKRRKVAR